MEEDPLAHYSVLLDAIRAVRSGWLKRDYYVMRKVSSYTLAFDHRNHDAIEQILTDVSDDMEVMDHIEEFHVGMTLKFHQPEQDV